METRSGSRPRGGSTDGAGYFADSVVMYIERKVVKTHAIFSAWLSSKSNSMEFQKGCRGRRISSKQHYIPPHQGSSPPSIQKSQHFQY